MIWLWLAITALVLALGAAIARARPRRAPAARQPYAGLGSETVAAPPPSQAAGFDMALPGPASSARVPAGVDVAGLLRAAREIFIGGAGDARRDVVTLNAQLLEVATEKGAHVATVHFSGLACEVPGVEAAGFEEVWNLVKPADSPGGWLPAGVQQMH